MNMCLLREYFAVIVHGTRESARVDLLTLAPASYMNLELVLGMCSLSFATYSIQLTPVPTSWGFSED